MSLNLKEKQNKNYKFMEKKFFSVKQASEYSSLSQRFLYEACQGRKLRFYKNGRRIVIDMQDLLEFITREPVEPIDWDEKARELLK